MEASDDSLSHGTLPFFAGSILFFRFGFWKGLDLPIFWLVGLKLLMLNGSSRSLVAPERNPRSRTPN